MVCHASAGLEGGSRTTTPTSLSPRRGWDPSSQTFLGSGPPALLSGSTTVERFIEPTEVGTVRPSRPGQERGGGALEVKVIPFSQRPSSTRLVRRVSGLPPPGSRRLGGCGSGNDWTQTQPWTEPGPVERVRVPGTWVGGGLTPRVLCGAGVVSVGRRVRGWRRPSRVSFRVTDTGSPRR